jgi:hypothetical protein
MRGFGRDRQLSYADLDELVGCDFGFLLGGWIADARQWANGTDAPASYYEWQARSQVSTWWPIAPSARSNPDLFTKHVRMALTHLVLFHLPECRTNSV